MSGAMLSISLMRHGNVKGLGKGNLLKSSISMLMSESAERTQVRIQPAANSSALSPSSSCSGRVTPALKNALQVPHLPVQQLWGRITPAEVAASSRVFPFSEAKLVPQVKLIFANDFSVADKRAREFYADGKNENAQNDNAPCPSLVLLKQTE